MICYIIVLLILKINRDLWVILLQTRMVLFIDNSQLVDGCL